MTEPSGLFSSDEERRLVSSDVFSSQGGDQQHLDSGPPQHPRSFLSAVARYLPFLSSCIDTGAREDVHEADEEEEFLWYGWVVRKCCPLILLLWTLALFDGYSNGPHLLSSLNPSIDAPKHSPSQVAVDEYARHFPHFSFDSCPFATVIVVQSRKNVARSVLDPAVERLSLALNNTFRCEAEGSDGQRKRCPEGKPWLRFVRRYEGYFLEEEEGVRAARKALFVNSGGTATQIIMRHEMQVLPESDLNFLYQDLEEFIAGRKDLAPFTVNYVGEFQLLNIAKDQAIYDFEHADMIGIPFAWVILYWYCGLPAVLVLITLPTSILFSFAMNDHYIPGKLPQFAPSLIVSIGVALNIDYALFILVRYTDELRKRVRTGEGPNVALDNALNTAGRTVGVSGTIMLVSNGSLSFVQAQTISSLGVGLALTNIVTMMINLTLLPALLHVSGNCFAQHLDFSFIKSLNRFLRSRQIISSTFPRIFSCCTDTPRPRSRFDFVTAPSREGAGDAPMDIVNEEWLKSFLETSVQEDGDTRSSIFCGRCRKGRKAKTLPEMFEKLNNKLNSQSLDESYQELPDFSDQLVLSDDFFSEAEERENNLVALQRSDDREQGDQPFSATRASSYEDNFSRMWHLIGNLCRKYPRAIILLSLALGSPLCIQVAKLKTTDSQDHLLPSSNRHVSLAHDIPVMGLNPGFLADFKAIVRATERVEELPREQCFDDNLLLGRINERFLHRSVTPTCADVAKATQWHCNVFVPQKNVTIPLGNVCPYSCSSCSNNLITSRSFFNHSAKVMQTLVGSMAPYRDKHQSEGIEVESPTYLFGHVISWEQAKKWIEMEEKDASPQAVYYRRVFSKSWGINHTAHLAYLYTPFQPFGLHAHPWITRVRDSLAKVDDSAYVSFVGGAATALFDQVDKVYTSTPAIMVTAVVFTVIGSSLLAFNSALLGPRLLLTIAFTLCLVFGSCVVLFQHYGLSPDSGKF